MQMFCEGQEDGCKAQDHPTAGGETWWRAFTTDVNTEDLKEKIMLS